MSFSTLVARALADKELDRLVAAARKTLDAIISTIPHVPKIREGYFETKRALESSSSKFGPPVFPNGQINALVFPLYTNFKTAVKAVEKTAKVVSNLMATAQVYGGVMRVLEEQGLKTDADSLWMAIQQINRFVLTTDDAFKGVPEYQATKNRIRDIVASRSSGLQPYDPAWLEVQVKAAGEVVPDESPSSGLGGPMALIVPVIIAVISSLTIIRVASSVVEVVGGKSRQVYLSYQEHEKRKAEVAERMRREGKSSAEIQAALTKMDEEQKRKVEEILKAPSGVDLTTILVGLGVAAGGLILISRVV